MIKFLSNLYEKVRVHIYIKGYKWANTGFIDWLKDKPLKKYQRELKAIVDEHNTLFFEFKDKSDIEHVFGRLTLLRINDYFQSVIMCIVFSQSHSIFFINEVFDRHLFTFKIC